ncbi:hypothetical protein ACIRVF_08460 [Kitasatospora sp. NPDC101157]|uniref:hypothetical protein n=1 Tax=Kitasatospora sp. NPDC101157 TaxID=3364098 RepID=UPI00382D4BD2
MPHPDPHTANDRLRAATLQLAMTGHASDFRRVAELLLKPGALNTDTYRVYIAHGPAPQRDHLLDRCQEAVGSDAFVARCLAYDTDIVIIAPLPPLDVTVGWDSTGTRLRHLINPHHDWHLGGSGITDLNHISQAYADASNALLGARYTTDRAALYSSDLRLASVVDDRAPAWAAALLAPLLNQPAARAEQLRKTIRFALVFNHTVAANLLLTSRNVVARRMRHVSKLLSLDLNRMRDRAILDLAIEVCMLADCGIVPTGDVPTLPDLLSTTEVHSWATSLLGRLDADSRPLRRSLLAWLTHDGHVDAAAGALGLRPAAVRQHLRAAETLLHRRLLGSQPHDREEAMGVVGSGGVYLAAVAVGEIEVGKWPEARPRL